MNRGGEGARSGWWAWVPTCFALALLTTAKSHAAEACRFDAPADLDATPARWLGSCQAGMAEGPGVLRAGTAEPFAFFAGRMHYGRPVRGLLILRDGGWMASVRFDDRLRVVSSDGLHPAQDDRVFAEAQTASRTVAERFRRAGNAASASYYNGLADRIAKGRPE